MERTSNSYNVNNIQSLIGQFRSIIKTSGKSEPTVRKYKEYVRNLIYLGKVQKEEVDYVYRLLGMQNTNVVKWNITLTRLDSFIKAMNYMVCCTKEQRRECLDKLLESNKVDNTVYRYIAELYRLNLAEPKKTLESYKNSKFGTFAEIKPKSEELKNVVVDNTVLDGLIREYMTKHDVPDFQNFYIRSRYRDRFFKFSDELFDLIKDTPLEKIVNTDEIQEVPQQLFRVQNIKYSENLMIALITYFSKGVHSTSIQDKVIAQTNMAIQFLGLDDEIINLFNQIACTKLYFKFRSNVPIYNEFIMLDTLNNMLDKQKLDEKLSRNSKSGIYESAMRKKLDALIHATSGVECDVKVGIYQSVDKSFQVCDNLSDTLNTYQRFFSFVLKQMRESLDVIEWLDKNMLDASCIV